MVARDEPGRASPLQAIALGAQLPESLRGAPTATALRSLGELLADDETVRARERLAELRPP
ncbi:MAG: hypothetical protein IPJ77_09835 [Planctomycetes bacterium]|nr:hypothetical protein [Planctomycetota bacterium]